MQYTKIKMIKYNVKIIINFGIQSDTSSYNNLWKVFGLDGKFFLIIKAYSTDVLSVIGYL